MPRGEHFKRTDQEKKRLSELSKKYIAEEKETGKYPPKQAVAIGLNRARTEVFGAKKKAPGKKEKTWWERLWE